MNSNQNNYPSDTASSSAGRINRRRFLRRAALATGATATLAGSDLLLGPAKSSAQQTGDIDPDILNFALNLEYLEAEYYLLAATGKGISAHGGGVSGTGTLGALTVKPDPRVPFESGFFADLAFEIAKDELAHVEFLRQALGSYKVAQPAIDLLNSFNALAKAAGFAESFDPFASSINFLSGAFVFEDVGVTAYNGAAPLITSKTYLGAAASILAVEAYHAGIIRTSLYDLGSFFPADRISHLRNELSGQGVTDEPIRINDKPNLVPADSNALAFSRSTREVLNIVYGGMGATMGLFFPSGLNGTIH